MTEMKKVSCIKVEWVNARWLYLNINTMTFRAFLLSHVHQHPVNIKRGLISKMMNIGIV